MATRKRARKYEHVLVDAFVHIPRYLLSDQEIEEIKELCTIEYMDGFPPRPRSTNIYKLSATFMTVPRALGEEIIEQHSDTWEVRRFKDEIFTPLPDDCQPNFDLYPFQEEASAKMIESCHRVGGCLLQGHCSFGKTRTAIVTAKRLGYRTLVIAPTNFLVQQWAASINDNMENAHVLIKPNELIARQKKRKNGGDVPGLFASWENTTHIIITIHSLAKPREDIDPDYLRLLATCGVVIADEAHKVPARTFRLCAQSLTSKYRIALTATPERKDNFHLWIYATFGPTAYKSDPKDFHDGGKLEVVYVPPHSIPQGTEAELMDMETEGFVEEGNSSAFTTRVKNMVTHPIWIQTVVDAIQNTLEDDPQRCILVLCLYKKQCEILDNRLCELGLTVNTLYADKRTATAENVLPGTIVVATFEQGGTGNDLKTDTLVLASAMANVNQAIGRIMRVPDRMLLIDIVYTSVKTFRKHFSQRKKDYEYYGFY